MSPFVVAQVRCRSPALTQFHGLCALFRPQLIDFSTPQRAKKRGHRQPDINGFAPRAESSHCPHLARGTTLLRPLQATDSFLPSVIFALASPDGLVALACSHSVLVVIQLRALFFRTDADVEDSNTFAASSSEGAWRRYDARSGNHSDAMAEMQETL